jgi:hypothetical protein
MSVLFITCGQWSDDRPSDGSSPRRSTDDSAYQPWRSAALATAALSLAVAPPLLAAAFTDSPDGRVWPARDVQPPILPRTTSPARINRG